MRGKQMGGWYEAIIPGQGLNLRLASGSRPHSSVKHNTTNTKLEACHWTSDKEHKGCGCEKYITNITQNKKSKTFSQPHSTFQDKKT